MTRARPRQRGGLPNRRYAASSGQHVHFWVTAIETGQGCKTHVRDSPFAAGPNTATACGCGA